MGGPASRWRQRPGVASRMVYIQEVCIGGGVHPGGGVGQTPIGYYGLRSTSGRYASYWNAFLFIMPPNTDPLSALSTSPPSKPAGWKPVAPPTAAKKPAASTATSKLASKPAIPAAASKPAPKAAAEPPELEKPSPEPVVEPPRVSKPTTGGIGKLQARADKFTLTVCVGAGNVANRLI